MSDLISRQDAIDAFGLSEKTRKYGGDHSGYNTMMLYEIQDILEGLPSAEPKTGGWIPCSERLPKAGRFRHYIITLRENYETINRVYEAWYTKSGWQLGSQMLADKDVIAWMPLPEPYKGVNE